MIVWFHVSLLSCHPIFHLCFLSSFFKEADELHGPLSLLVYGLFPVLILQTVLSVYKSTCHVFLFNKVLWVFSFLPHFLSGCPNDAICAAVSLVLLPSNL